MENIVIVGGGISGLYLAHSLLKRGERRIHIYEATDRLGGRIYERRFHDFNAPMGGSMIRLSDTRVIKLCQELNLDLKRVDATLMSEESQFINDMVERIINAYEPSKYGMNVSVMDFLKMNFTDEEVTKYVNYSIYRDFTLSSIHEYVMDYPITDHLQVPVSSFVVKGGYSRLIDALVKSVKDLVTIRLNTPIRKVTNKFIITEDGSKKKYDSLFWTVTENNKQLLLNSFPKMKILNSILGVPFLKMYAYVDSTKDLPSIVVGGILGKMFPLSKNILMIVYTDGKYADELYGKIKDMGQEELKSFIQNLVREVNGFENVELLDLTYKYWEAGIHQYRTYPVTIRRRYDNITLIGEAVSRNHGWAEGALESINGILNKKV